MTLAELRTDLQSFAVGHLPADAFAGKLQALIVDTPLEMALPGGPLDGSVAEQLVARLAFHFEDLGDDPEARRWQARTLVAALDALAHPVVLDLLPLLFTKERFAGIVQKYLAGIISRTGFVAAVSSTQLPAALQQWLYSASAEALEQFAGYLRTDDFGGVQQITGLAAA